MDAARERLSEAEYLARERESDQKHEYLGGVAIAMAGAGARHNLVAMNIGAALTGALRGGPCVALSSDQRIHVARTGLYTYPDVVVACGELELVGPSPRSLRNPRLVVEVLSRSTEAYDRGEKFDHYATIPGLAGYLVVDPRRERVEHYRRLEDGGWKLTRYGGREGEVPLPELDVALALADVFANVDRVPADDVAPGGPKS